MKKKYIAPAVRILSVELSLLSGSGSANMDGGSGLPFDDIPESASGGRVRPKDRSAWHTWDNQE